MSIIQPLGAVTRTFGGEFDFPRGLIVFPDGSNLNPCAPGEAPNIPPGDDEYTLMERWYDRAGFGKPKARQGWATMYEEGALITPEEEDPDIAPFVDLMLDRDRGIVINHTSRFSGRMVELINNKTFECRIRIAAHPLMAATGQVDLYDTDWVVIESFASHVPNKWFLLNSSTMVYTLRYVFPKSDISGDAPDANYKLSVPGIYRLIIDWDVRHKVAGDPDYHYEVLGGFDHNLVFRVGYQTSE